MAELVDGDCWLRIIASSVKYMLKVPQEMK